MDIFIKGCSVIGAMGSCMTSSSRPSDKARSFWLGANNSARIAIVRQVQSLFADR